MGEQLKLPYRAVEIVAYAAELEEVRLEDHGAPRYFKLRQEIWRVGEEAIVLAESKEELGSLEKAG